MNKNYWFIMLGGALWGTTGFFTKLFSVYFNVSAHQLSFAKMFCTAVIMFIWLLLFDRDALKFKLKDIWVFLGSGVIGHCFFTYCYYTSIESNGMAAAAVLLYTAPIFVTLFSAVLFKSRITVFKLVAMVLAVVGCALVSGVATSSVKAFTSFGTVVGLLAGLGYSLYTIFGRLALNKGYKNTTLAFYTFLFASLGAFVREMFGGELLPKNDKSTPLFILFVILFATITGVVPYFFYNLGLKKTDPPIASVLASAEPVVATVTGIAIFGENFNVPIVIGIALVLLSIFTESFGEIKLKQEKL